jgi:hypothetical protein
MTCCWFRGRKIFVGLVLVVGFEVGGRAVGLEVGEFFVGLVLVVGFEVGGRAVGLEVGEFFVGLVLNGFDVGEWGVGFEVGAGVLNLEVIDLIDVSKAFKVGGVDNVGF